MPDVSDIIRRVFQPGGQVAAEPKRRADSSKNQVRGRGNVQRTLRSHAASGTARPVAGTSPRLLQFLRSRACCSLQKLALKERKSLKPAPLVVPKEVCGAGGTQRVVRSNSPGPAMLLWLMVVGVGDSSVASSGQTRSIARFTRSYAGSERLKFPSPSSFSL